MDDILIHQIPKPIFIYDLTNLKFLDVNSAAEDLYGYNREDFLEIDLTDLYSPEDIQTLIESSERQTISGSVTGPWRHKTKDGSTIYVEIGKSKLEFKGRKAHLNIIEDVTDNVKNDIDFQFRKIVVEHSDNPILRIDSEGLIIFANRILTKKLGISEHELKNRSILTIIDDNERDKTLRVLKKLKEGEPLKIELTFTSFDTSMHMREAKFIPILNFDKSINSYAVIIKPPQEIKIERIEVPVEVQVEVPVEVPVEVEKIVHVPSQSHSGGLDSSFLSHLFHEILTPINVIVGFGQEIVDSIEQPTAEQIEWKDIIDENQKMLLQILNIAAEYASVETDQINIKTELFSFVSVLDEVEESIRKISKSKGVEFAYGKISSSLKIETDKQRFLTFVNLLLNYAISVTKSEKVFLSANPHYENEFIFSLKESSNSTDIGLYDKLNLVFNEEESVVRQKFGFSRFSIRLAKKLIKLLAAKFIPFDTLKDKSEFGFILPLKLEPAEIQKISEIDTPKEKEEKIKPAVETESTKPEMAKHNLVEDPKASSIEEKIDQPVEQPAEEIATEIEIPPVEDVKPVPEPKVAVADTESKEFDYSNFTCLYIEDQIDSQLLLKAQMRDLKEIDFVTDFEDAIPLLNSKKYDFIITDINLQGEYNGLDALRIIQKTPGYQNVAVIAVTAYALPGDRDRFIEAGFFEFISKPLMKNKLLEILKRIFN